VVPFTGFAASTFAGLAAATGFPFTALAAGLATAAGLGGELFVTSGFDGFFTADSTTDFETGFTIGLTAPLEGDFATDFAEGLGAIFTAGFGAGFEAFATGRTPFGANFAGAGTGFLTLAGGLDAALAAGRFTDVLGTAPLPG
jgi:hypothetical protein